MEELQKEKINALWNKESYYQLIEDCRKFGGDGDMFLADKIVEVIQNYDLRRIIDVGCGEGSTIQYVKKMTKNKATIFQGVDVAEIGINRANKKMITNADFQLYDGIKVPFNDNYFDLAISTFVFEHLENPEQIFIEMTRVVRKSGFICIACPNYGSPFFRSPCNRSNKLFLLIGRLLKSLYPSRLFSKSFQWRRVEPIKLGESEHIMDYDTTIEPNLFYLLKFLKENKGKYVTLEASSFWDKYEYGGENYFKKIFMQTMAFLGRTNLPFFRYCGPFFYVLLQKA